MQNVMPITVNRFNSLLYKRYYNGCRLFMRNKYRYPVFFQNFFHKAFS